MASLLHASFIDNSDLLVGETKTAALGAFAAVVSLSGVLSSWDISLAGLKTVRLALWVEEDFGALPVFSIFDIRRPTLSWPIAPRTHKLARRRQLPIGARRFGSARVVTFTGQIDPTLSDELDIGEQPWTNVPAAWDGNDATAATVEGLANGISNRLVIGPFGFGLPQTLPGVEPTFTVRVFARAILEA